LCPAEIRSVDQFNEGTMRMIVIGVDTHKRSHTLVALDAGTGVTRGQRTILASEAGELDALRFAVELDIDRVWAVEDCRHVSARLERALLAAGERVIRVPPSMTGPSRKASRVPGKSDPIDATAVALAAIREGVDSLPVAFLDEQATEIRVLCDYRDQIINERTRLISRLRWHLVRIAPELEAQLLPAALKGPRIRARLARQLARLPSAPQLRVAKALLKRINEISREERELLAELTALIQEHAPQLLDYHGCGTVTAAVIIGRTAGAKRFRSEACFARHAGTAPIPASSGNTNRHRLHRGGDRQTEPRDPHHRALPCQDRSDNPRVPRPQTRRGQDQARRDPLSQATHRQTRLAPPLHQRDHATDGSVTASHSNRRRGTSAHAMRSLKPTNSDPHLT
jgi:transposase